MTPSGIAGRFAAILVRLALLVVIAAATGVLIGAMFLPAALATNDVFRAVRTDILDIPPLGEADTPPQNSYVYAADGSELAEINFEENRVPITLDEVPQIAIDAVLATEDAQFYEHEGVNHSAMVRAFLTNLRAGGIESGASTITQQYVKLTFLTPEQTYQRKIEEAIYAIQLEQEYSKDEILERYLNRSYFGSGVYGIGTAAERYFSKDLADLTLGEAAMLAGLLRAPIANNPIASMENAQARRDIVLRQMAEHGFVSRDQAQAAIDEPLEVEISEPPPPEYPFWVRWVSQLLINENTAGALGTQVDAMQAMGDTREERNRTVHQSGLRIHTTLDPELQDLAEATLRERLTYEDEPPEEVAQEPFGSIVSIEPGTGAIRAMALGPRDFGSCIEDDSWVGQTDDGELLCDRTQVNMAVPGMGGSGRQPGSAFKPFVQAAALEAGLSPGLTMEARSEMPIVGCENRETDSGWWEPRNSGRSGLEDMYSAMAVSSNVYHALLVAEITPDAVAEMARRLGVPVATDTPQCPIALGAYDTTPLHMANGFATLANRGERCDAFPITRIEDERGRILWEHSPNCEQVLDAEIADRLVDILEGPVAGPGGTATVANLDGYPTRGKTGTTSDFRDAWFVGFVKQLSTAAWLGYENGNRYFVDNETARGFCDDRAGEGIACPADAFSTRLMEDVTIAGEHYPRVFGGTIAAPMWADYMNQAVQRYEPEDFPDPGPIPTGRVPNLLDASSVEEAEDLAEEAGFRLRVEEVEDYRPEGTFVAQDPEPGTTRNLGDMITLEMSDGTGEPPELPDVTGMPLDEAVEVLHELGYLNLFQRDVEVEDEDDVDVVVGMDPEAGTRLDPDEDPRIVLEIGVPAPEPDEDEDDEDDEDEDDGDNGGGGGGGGPPIDPPGQSD